MPGRKFVGVGSYNYGFNGKENDNEVKGSGSQQEYGMRIYDPRLGKFLSVDPLTKNYPFYTPYQFTGNSPILSVDIDGLEGSVTINKSEKKITVETRIKYTDEQKKKIESAGLSFERFKQDYYHQFQTTGNGYSQAVNEITKVTGLKPDEVEKMQQGGIPKGTDGNFTINIKGIQYSISYSLKFSKGFDANDPTVNTLVINKEANNSYDARSRRVFLDLRTYTYKLFSHELGHQYGLPDLYSTMQGYKGDKNEFGLNPRIIPVKVGGYSFAIGEFMDTWATHPYLSVKSIINSLSTAIDVSNKTKENVVDIHLGGAIYFNLPDGSVGYDRMKTRILKGTEKKAFIRNKIAGD